jgi:hypothetical protein
VLGQRQATASEVDWSEDSCSQVETIIGKRGTSAALRAIAESQASLERRERSSRRARAVGDREVALGRVPDDAERRLGATVVPVVSCDRRSA